MSIQRIDIPKKRTHGWQARAHVRAGLRLTAFYADQLNGGRRAAQRLAKAQAEKLKKRAKALRERMQRSRT
jgi:hypothetical protein